MSALKGLKPIAQGIALGFYVGVEIFALKVQKHQAAIVRFCPYRAEVCLQHKNPGRCPGLFAAAPLGRRWVTPLAGDYAG